MQKKKSPIRWLWRILAILALFLSMAGGFSLFCFTLAIIFLILWIRGKLSARAYEKQATAELDTARQSIQQMANQLNDFDQHVKQLEKFQPIVDVEQECEKLRDLADTEAALVRATAQAEKDAALKARQDAETEASRIVGRAEMDAKQIIAKADEEAHRIAGAAYEAKQKADEYQATVIALKNVIAGYGDEWLKPTYSLLDELADDFGYEEAGQKLAAARAKSIRMVKNGEAATCDYAEAYRRARAISFVEDAFNGKVDTILAKSKKDNYGRLEQQIKDAFHLVNMNGTAFRNARITPQYLDARLDELKWAAVCQELKTQKQEEERRIREQIREEERARREYERAQKEAAKEEDMLRKAMEKAQAAMEQASAERRAEYEAQLADLQQKLTEAEEKSQRALSMAQQTKRGNVYVISNIGSFGENVYKVGMTRRLDPMDRVRELGDASVPFSFDVHAIIESDDAPALETGLHKALALMQVNKVNPRKEFFRVNLSDIRRMVENMGLTANWTMEAAATEYRETLAIEENMKSDPEAKRRWEEYNASLAVEDMDDELETA